MRKIILLASFLVYYGVINAQQLHMMSQYIQHNSLYNPAAAGFSENPVIGISYRNMWSSFPGNPITMMLYGDTRWDKKKSGMAGYIYKDQTGPTSRTGMQLAYSYHVKTGEKSHLGLGLEITGLQYAIDRSKLAESLGTNDPAIMGSGNSFIIDGGAGAYYSNGRLSLGASISQLIQSKLNLSKLVPNATERAKLYNQYYFSGSYVIPTGDNINLIPNCMSTVVPHAPTEFEFGCKLDYQQKIWWGLNWRIRQFWSIQAGFKLFNRLSLAYCYDYYTSPFSDYNSGNNAHEIGLRFELPKKNKAGK